MLNNVGSKVMVVPAGAFVTTYRKLPAPLSFVLCTTGSNAPVIGVGVGVLVNVTKAVGDDVGVAVDVAGASKAPISQAEPCGRPMPRWSTLLTGVVAHTEALPAS